MLKRLIEVGLPLKEVSEQSAREKSIRHGHISTLHIWWARRPLAACRAVVFASLIPDPDDPECPTSFRQLVMDLLGGSQFKPTQAEPSPGAAAPVEAKPLEDTPRNRCLEFIKHLVRWENSNDPEYIEPARRLIKAAHKILHPDSQDEAPKVLDPFAGGGAIPLEALRLGCEAHAIDINPVAHLIELCTLVYPQKFGKPLPPDAPVPDYIIEAATADGKSDGLFGGSVAEAEVEYRRNPLSADVKYWGNWVLGKARKELAEFYPPDRDGSVPVAYLWARTVKCPNPACGATIPMIGRLWLCRKTRSRAALRLTLNPQSKLCEFSVAKGKEIDFDPDKGTMQRGDATCPFCNSIADAEYLRGRAASDEGLGAQLVATVIARNDSPGKDYRAQTKVDVESAAAASHALANLLQTYGNDVIPTEAISRQQPRLMWVTNYGVTHFSDLFTARQLLALSTLAKLVNEAGMYLSRQADNAYAAAVQTFLGFVLDRQVNQTSTCCRMDVTRETLQGTYARQGLPLMWDFAEGTVLSDTTGGWPGAIDWIVRTLENCVEGEPGVCRWSSATQVPYEENSLDAVITDPPYYDAVPYADLSDFFYVWLRRSVDRAHPELLRTPLTPKAQELIEERPHRALRNRKDSAFYEEGMADAFAEMNRVLEVGGVGLVMFAHKTTAAWETLIAALLHAGSLVTASWPLHTEMTSRMIARDTAALASSVSLVCRKRDIEVGDGLWDDIRRELREVASERLDYFWEQGIRGADFFISAIGPALSVFGRYELVVRLSGEEVTVGQFLDEVRDLVTHYALNKIVKGGQVGHIDAESQFYVVWRWSYGGAKVPADEAFKLAQALGFDTEMMWDKTGVLEKSGQNVSAVPIDKRMRIKTLGEPKADGASASLIDVLHRLCAFRDKGDAAAAGEFLTRSGHARTGALWLVAQAIGEMLPDGDKEKQLLQGLLNQRESLQRGESRLF